MEKDYKEITRRFVVLLFRHNLSKLALNLETQQSRRFPLSRLEENFSEGEKTFKTPNRL